MMTFVNKTIYNKIMMSTVLVVLMLFVAGVGEGFAQSDRSHIRQGNRHMRGGAEGGAAKAEVSYRKAQAVNPANTQAMYNLGCALMAQQKDSAALEAFKKAATAEQNKGRRAMSYHNMGVIAQRHQQYGDAIEAYKQALRLCPNDNETRYNLVLCKRQQKNQQQNNNNSGGGGNDNKDKDKNKDKKNNKDKDKNKNDQNNDKQDKQDQQKQQQDKQMSRENAEQLLNAAMQEEKQTQERMKKAMSQPRRRTLQKNW